MNGKVSLLLLSALVLSWGSASGQEVGVDRPGSDLRPGFVLGAPDPALCAQACASDPDCKAYTYVRPGYQGPEARCWLKSAVPKAVKNDCCVSGVPVRTAQIGTGKLLLPVADIGGTWTSNDGLTYQIEQKGTSFSWSNSDKLEGSGTINMAGSLTMNWTDSAGTRSATGLVFASDAQGKPVKLAWNNGVMLERGVSGPVALEPIPMPSPNTQSAAASKVQADPIPLPKPKGDGDQVSVKPIPMPKPIMDPDPLTATASSEALEILSAAMQRRDLIEALSANPATRSTLEDVAQSAQMAIGELASTQIPLSAIAEKAGPQVPKPLLEIWKAPVHVSPIAPGPWYSDDKARHTVGMMVVPNILSWGWLPCSISEMAKTGVVCLYSDEIVTDEYGNHLPAPLQLRIDIETPPGGGAYIVDLFLTSSAEGTDLSTFTSLQVGAVNEWSQSVPLISKSDGSGLIGLFTISDDAKVSKGIFSMKQVSASMLLQVEGAADFKFGGVTITRI